MKYYQIIYKGEVVGEIKVKEQEGAEFVSALKQKEGVSLVPLKPPTAQSQAGGIGAAMVRAMIGNYERRNQY